LISYIRYVIGMYRNILSKSMKGREGEEEGERERE
jgi:hypothetical protein